MHSDLENASGAPVRMPLSSSVKVTVVLLTYNHERFIDQAIESVLMQKADFAYECVIIEDCSTDDTRRIVRRYQAKHPEKIRLMLPPRNKNSNEDWITALGEARGQYIASLDGDDFWTSPHKLQKQADFLDAHLHCSACYHNCWLFFDDPDKPAWLHHPAPRSPFSTLKDLVRENFIGSLCNVMFRRGLFKTFPDPLYPLAYADWTTHLLNACHGPVGYIDGVLAAHRFHQGGLWASQTQVAQITEQIRYYQAARQVLDRAYWSIIDERILSNYLALALKHLRGGRPGASLRHLVSTTPMLAQWFRNRSYPKLSEPVRQTALP